MRINGAGDGTLVSAARGFEEAYFGSGLFFRAVKLIEKQNAGTQQITCLVHDQPDLAGVEFKNRADRE